MRKIFWSVELEVSLWTDDTFNGTFEECVKYCKENDYKIDGKDARLCKILVDDEGTFLETLEVVESLEE